MAAVWPPIMTNGDGTPLRNFYFVERALKELTGGLGKMWLAADRKPEIAILYSQITDKSNVPARSPFVKLLTGKTDSFVDNTATLCYI